MCKYTFLHVRNEKEEKEKKGNRDAFGFAMVEDTWPGNGGGAVRHRSSSDLRGIITRQNASPPHDSMVPCHVRSRIVF